MMVSSKFTFFNKILKLNAQSGDLEMFLKSVDHANQPLAWKHCLEGNTAFRLLRKYYITNLSKSTNTKFILLWTRPELRSILQWDRNQCYTARAAFQHLYRPILLYCLFLLGQFAERIADIRKPDWDNHYLTKWLVGKFTPYTCMPMVYTDQYQSVCIIFSIVLPAGCQS